MAAMNKSLAQMSESPDVAKRLTKRAALPAPMHSWDQMKPRTVYEKAVQDFTETAQQLARLEQHFCQASFAEFKCWWRSMMRHRSGTGCRSRWSTQANAQ